MNSRIRCFSFATLLLAAGISCSPSQAANIIHVSPDGSDNNSGASHAPLATFEAARDTVRNFRQKRREKRTQAFTVLVQPGTYPLTRTLELGSKDHDTIWKAARPDTVFITGGSDFKATGATPLTPAEKERIITVEARDKILRLDLEKAGITCDLGTLSQRGFAKAYRPLQAEISIDGKILDLARWPNGMVAKGGIFETRFEAMSKKTLTEHYPFMKGYMRNDPATPKGNVFERNITFNSGGLGGNQSFMEFKNNLDTTTDPGFADPAANQWQLDPTPEARKVLGKAFTPSSKWAASQNRCSRGYEYPCKKHSPCPLPDEYGY